MDNVTEIKKSQTECLSSDGEPKKVSAEEAFKVAQERIEDLEKKWRSVVSPEADKLFTMTAGMSFCPDLFKDVVDTLMHMPERSRIEFILLQSVIPKGPKGG